MNYKKDENWDKFCSEFDDTNIVFAVKLFLQFNFNKYVSFRYSTDE